MSWDLCRKQLSACWVCSRSWRPDSILNTEESSGRTRERRGGGYSRRRRRSEKKSRLNPGATDGDKTRRESGREAGGVGWLCRAAVISRVVFFPPLITFTQLPEDLLYESTRVRFEPIAAGVFGEQPINRESGRVLRCSSRREAQLAWDALAVLLDFRPSRRLLLSLSLIHLIPLTKKASSWVMILPFLILKFLFSDKSFLHLTVYTCKR